MRRSPHARYLAQIALGFALGAVLLPGYVELFPINVFHREYAIWSSHLDFAERPAAPEPELLILGDSRAHAGLRTGELPGPARSLAGPGATPIEAYFLLTRYLEHHAPPRNLVVSFSPFHLEYADTFWQQTAKWKLLRTRDALAVFRRCAELGDPVLGEPVAPALARRWLRTRLNLPGDYAAELKKSRLVMRRWGNLRFRDEIDAAAGHALYGHAGRSSDSNQEVGRVRFRASPLFESYLDDLLSLAAERGIRTWWLSMPMNRSSFERLAPRYREDHAAFVERLSRAHPELEIRGGLWALPDDHFGDGSHVNERGAGLVTGWAAELLGAG